MKHAIVVGAGIVGLASADALLRRGFRVTVLERERIAGAGCSYGNGGLVVPSHFEPLAAPGMIATGLRMLRSKESPFGFRGVPDWEMLRWMGLFAGAANHRHVEKCGPVLRDLNLASRALYEERFGDLNAGYARRGELMVCRTEAGLEAEAKLGATAAGLGLKTTLLDRAALAAFEPKIAYDAAGAVYFEDDAHLTPAVFMDALRKRILAAGGTFCDGDEATGFAVSGDRVTSVSVGGESLDADEYVLAAGAWTGRLAAKLGLRMPLLAGKGYGITVAQPPAMPQYPAILVDGRVAVTPMQDGLRFVGTMELGPPGDAAPNQARIRGMRRTIAEFYPAFRETDLTTEKVWAGLRPCPPDGMPYLGRSRRASNVIFATGHGMMGMSLGPISGEIVAQIATDSAPSVPLELMAPDRYA